MLRASLGKVVHTVKRAGTYAAKVSHKELHKIAEHVRAVGQMKGGQDMRDVFPSSILQNFNRNVQEFCNSWNPTIL
jgi:hypothetical protein